MLIVAYAKAVGAVYQLSKIRLIKIEPLEDYMKHLTKVGRSSKLIQRKFVRVRNQSFRRPVITSILGFLPDLQWYYRGKDSWGKTGYWTGEIGDGLNSRQKSIIDRCVRKLYIDIARSREKYIPIMSDFYDLLLEQPEEEAKDIALSLELFISDSLNIFNHQTNVDVDNRFTCLL